MGGGEGGGGEGGEGVPGAGGGAGLPTSAVEDEPPPLQDTQATATNKASTRNRLAGMDDSGLKCPEYSWPHPRDLEQNGHGGDGAAALRNRSRK